jgi:hypothetical protein
MRNVDPARRALEQDAPAVRAHDVLDDREAEAAALARAREPVVDAVELVEDAAVLAARNPAAVVAHLDGDPVAGSERARRPTTGGVPPYFSAFESRFPIASTMAWRSA